MLKLSFLKNYLIRRWKKAKFAVEVEIINNFLIEYFLVSNDRFKIILSDFKYFYIHLYR